MKPKLIFINWFPTFITGAKATTIGTYVIVKRGWWKSKTPAERANLIGHEMVHIGQYLQHGVMKYVFKYLFSKRFRYEMELEAYCLANLQNIQRDGYPKWKAENIVARDLSSGMYCRMVSYEQAIRDVQNYRHRLPEALSKHRQVFMRAGMRQGEAV